jgi:cbb3-type cytochrome oxidase maturation protein
VDVVILLVFISLALVAAGLIFFISRLREGDFDHGERLALSPLADDAAGRNGTEEANSASQSDKEKQSTETLEGGTLHVGS